MAVEIGESGMRYICPDVPSLLPISCLLGQQAEIPVDLAKAHLQWRWRSCLDFFPLCPVMLLSLRFPASTPWINHLQGISISGSAPGESTQDIILIRIRLVGLKPMWEVWIVNCKVRKQRQLRLHKLLEKTQNKCVRNWVGDGWTTELMGVAGPWSESQGSRRCAGIHSSAFFSKLLVLFLSFTVLISFANYIFHSCVCK